MLVDVIETVFIANIPEDACLATIASRWHALKHNGHLHYKSFSEFYQDIKRRQGKQ